MSADFHYRTSEWQTDSLESARRAFETLSSAGYLTDAEAKRVRARLAAAMSGRVADAMLTAAR